MKKLVQVMGAGSGNPDVQDCPPMYHFELTSDELMSVIANPSEIARQLGVEVKKVHIASSNEPHVEGAKTMYCCVNCLTDSLCCQKWPEADPKVRPT